MPNRRHHAAVLLLAALLMSSCAAAPDTDPTDNGTVNATPSVPPGAVTLADLGFTHGPAGAISLPGDISIRLRTDQRNVLTVVLDRPAARAVAAHLRATLPSGGFTIRADSGDAVVFTGHGWEGSFAAGADGGSALSLRRSGQ